MPAYRCSDCGISWPARNEFDECQKCGEETSGINNINPDMTLEEARSMANGFKFERFYEARTPDLVMRPSELKFTLERWRKQVEGDRRKQAQKDLGTTPTLLPANSGTAAA